MIAVTGAVRGAIRVNPFYAKLVELVSSLVMPVTAICSTAPYDVVCFPPGMRRTSWRLAKQKKLRSGIVRLMCGSGFSQKSRGSVSSIDCSQIQAAEDRANGYRCNLKLKIGDDSWTAC